MKRQVRNYFIPTEENDYAPHALQKISGMVMLVLILISFSVANLHSLLWISSDWLVGTVLPAVVVELTNKERSGESLQSLTRNATLDEAARLKAEDMARRGYFAHNSPDGLTPWHWFDQAGYSFIHAGENLAVHFTDSENLVDAWMGSPGHRANILGGNYTEIGVGTAKGTYEGYDTVFVVQLFGAPAVEAFTENVEDTAVVSAEPEEATPVVDDSVAIVQAGQVASEESSSEDVLAEAVLTLEEDGAPSSTEGSMVMYSDLATTSRPGTPAPLGEGKGGGGGESMTTYEPTVLEKVATGPQLWLQALYGVLALFVLGSVILSIVIEWRRHRPVQVAYGAALMATMAMLFYVHVMVTSGVTIA